MRTISKHNERANILDSIAILSGFDLCRAGSLPDGKRPDVLRVFPMSGAVFIGDAKDTERPNNKATMRRLLNYMAWFRIVAERNVGSIFTVCFGNENDAAEWARTMRSLADKVGLQNYRIEFSELSPADFLVAVLPTKRGS